MRYGKDDFFRLRQEMFEYPRARAYATHRAMFTIFYEDNSPAGAVSLAGLTGEVAILIYNEGIIETDNLPVFEHADQIVSYIVTRSRLNE